MEDAQDTTFPGLQEGEKILSVITPHPSVFTLEYVKLITASLLVLVGFCSLNKISPIFVTIGILLSITALILGGLLYHSLHSKRIAYITDRRIVRFEPSNAFVVNHRSLNWNDTSKVKTFSTSLLWRLKNIGTVVIHSKTSSATVNTTDQTFMTNDDIVLKNVHYYKDLGNYLDKILYLHKNDKSEIQKLHPFVPKPKGQRY
ncbi:hypothetical protein COY20_03235 [Candidatus Shapirobacteria bacterium CG_4_10_14_0_2_um_filter_40_12]|uniref:DUF304 domain-containing protein n=1 Tax=Candidatus Shapirobacteria bacterium CG_4_10_14_0_2_um_filter_40_12 TaxID=1974871 RepID=A0A2M7TSJ7_9BACT|nr:MAG: hypothetical protein COY20_03235 [Candidatus Shapirobacteria bacterium CG_4_10_14_0_2_um_filter_40_12]